MTTNYTDLIDRVNELSANKIRNSTNFHAGYHNFHVPVMGTGFTVDSPLRLAKYGITSVISLGDDRLLERMREFYALTFNKPYRPIPTHDMKSRIRRIRSYLNLVHEQVQTQLSTVRSSLFEPGSDIVRYFELLPSGELKSAYQSMLTCPCPETKLKLQAALRQCVVAGRIDVNIMTKVDRELSEKDGKGIPESGLAMTALCAFATSKLQSSVVLSAGLNRRLFAYMAQFDDFFPSTEKPPQKTITLKVSDFRSASLQSTLLAKRGLWVSEYRIESGLNCGGHAFATMGDMLGPVLEKFQANRESLLTHQRELYFTALRKLGRKPYGDPPIVVSAQGGVGTAEEHEFLREHYAVNSVGWGTPFLLVPEATNVDNGHLSKLMKAGEKEAVLSDASPLGIPFWMLQGSSSEEHRLKLIEKQTPGSPCPKRYLVANTEFTQSPICTASAEYQKLKLNQLEMSSLPPKQKQASISALLSKSCLCLNLAGSVLNRLGIDDSARGAICCGPSIADFDRVCTLKEMVDHIYGRHSLKLPQNRPNMFIRELFLYVDHLRNQWARKELNLLSCSEKYFDDFKRGLLAGISYYQQMANQLKSVNRESFLKALAECEIHLRSFPDTALGNLCGSQECVTKQV